MGDRIAAEYAQPAINSGGGRQSESLERARHSRGERMRAQAEQAGDLRRRNQALVHNVLPPHVARHFMGARHHHADLYSQSYAEVGVLFASMPNFTGFIIHWLCPAVSPAFI